jgi:CubicO group peptidase (beta-lactamase class C family)
MSSLPLLFALSVSTAVHANGSEGLPRAAPEQEGVSSQALLDFVNAAEQRVDALHSFILVRHGQVVAEGWWAPYAANEPHSLYSLSKSFTSTAVGMAIAEGKLSLDDSVLSFFPEEAPANPSRNLKAMRVRDLLRMATGHRTEPLHPFPFDSKLDLVRVFLELPVDDKPGTHFVYNTPATYMLSAIVQKVTGQTILDYLKPRLFDPLGIENPTWDASAQGISLGGLGLSVRTEDIARFGQLYLQKGQWQGRQLLPAAWIEEATSLRIANGSDPSSDWDQGYGYQFWRCRHGFYRGDGAFGQFCIVMPQEDAVLAMTSASRNIQSILDVVWDKLLPALKDGPLAADPGGDQALAGKLASLTLPTQWGQAGSPTAASVAGRRYVFPENDQHLEWLELESADPGGQVALRARVNGSETRIVYGHGTWLKGLVEGGPAGAVPVAACGAWTSDDTFSAKLCRYRTPYMTSFDVRFAGDRLVLDSEDNVNLDEVRRVRLVGRIAPQNGP